MSRQGKDVIADAVGVMAGTRLLVSEEMQRSLLEIETDLLECHTLAGLRMIIDDSLEPRALRRTLDEIKIKMDHAHLLAGDDRQHQFYHRALCAALTLVTIRYSVMERAGRVREDRREPSAEAVAMEDGYTAERCHGGRMRAVGPGAAIQDACMIGRRGGAWTAFLLDVAP